MSTKCGNYSGSGKNPLSESSIRENGDKGDRSPSYPDYAGGKTGSRVDPDLKYSGGNSGYSGA
jgi:hypothetical protein